MIDNAKIRYTYNINYMYLKNSTKRPKHLKLYDMIDKSKQYTLSIMIASKNNNTEYITYNNKKQPLKSVISKIKYTNRQGITSIKYIINNGYFTTIQNGIINTYKIYGSNKLNVKKVDKVLKDKLYNM